MFLVSLKDGGRRVSPRVHLFVPDVNQGNEVDLPRAVKNRECALKVGCGGVFMS